MGRSTEELLARVSASRHPIENLLVQFSVLSLVIMTILGIVLSVILTTRVNRNFELVKDYAFAVEGRAPGTGAVAVPDLDTDLVRLQWTTYVAVGGGFIILYAGLVSIVWRGWRTIKMQQTDLLETNSDLRAAYDELRQAQERLVRTERLAAIGELSAGMAHDLRNPLGAVKNAVYYLKGKLRDSELAAENPKISEFLDIMEEEVDSSNQILADLMEFARVSQPQRTATELESVVDSALARFKVKDSVDVIKSFDPSIPAVMADRDQLRRAFTNLTQNADEAMADGGTLTISGSSNGGFVEVEFRDTGEGIDTRDVPRVMDPLFTTKGQGHRAGAGDSRHRHRAARRHREGHQRQGARDDLHRQGPNRRELARVSFLLSLPPSRALRGGRLG